MTEMPQLELHVRQEMGLDATKPVFRGVPTKRESNQSPHAEN